MTTKLDDAITALKQECDILQTKLTTLVSLTSNWGRNTKADEKKATVDQARKLFGELTKKSTHIKILLEQVDDSVADKIKIIKILDDAEILWNEYLFKIIEKSAEKISPRPTDNQEMAELIKKIAEMEAKMTEQQNNNTIVAQFKEISNNIILSSHAVKCPIMQKSDIESAASYNDYERKMQNYHTSNPSIPHQIKVQELKEATKGVEAARQLTETFVIGEITMEECMEKMRQRFKNLKGLLFQSLTQLFNPITKHNDSILNNLTNLVDVYTAKKDTLMRMAKEELEKKHPDGPAPTNTEILAMIAEWTFLYNLWRNMPESMQTTVSNQLNVKENDIPEAALVIEKLKIKINVLKNSKDVDSAHQSKPKPHTASMKYAATINNHEESPCVVCPDKYRNSHKTYDCKYLKTADHKKRYKMLEKTKICKVCLLFPWNVCRCCDSQKELCKICNSPKHHYILCEQYKTPRNLQRFRQFNENRNSNGNSNNFVPQQQKPPTQQLQQNQRNTTPKSNATTGNYQGVQSATANVAKIEASTDFIEKAWHPDENMQPVVGTLLVRIGDNNGKYISTYAMADDGAQMNTMTPSLAKQLNLEFQPCNVATTGFNQIPTGEVKEYTFVNLKGRNGIEHEDLPIKIAVTVCDNLPPRMPTNRCYMPPNLQIKKRELADPKWNKPKPVQLLLCTTTMALIKKEGGMCVNGMYFQASKLGYIASGTAELMLPTNSINMKLETNIITKEEKIETDSILKQMRDEENLRKQIHLENLFLYKDEENPQNVETERILAFKEFQEKAHHKPDGTFVVPMLMKPNVQLGNSEKRCLARNMNMFERLSPENRAAAYKQIYDNVDKGIWREVDQTERHQGKCYNPLVAVLRPGHATSPLRLCQDSSMLTDNGVSLNAAQMKTECLLTKIPDMILKLRKNVVGISGDIKAMFLNVEICENDKKFQRTLLRDENGKIREYEINRVVFGEATSPYLCQMVLKTLADKYKNEFPIGCQEIEDNFYCDDWVSSGKNVSETKVKIFQTSQVLKSGEMPLRKYCSNNKQALDDVPEEFCAFPKDDDENVIHRTSVLGYIWQSQPDDFIALRSSFPKIEENSKLTKRKGAHIVGKLYDPSGFFEPVAMAGRRLNQEMWKNEQGINVLERTKAWEHLLPENLNTKFIEWNNSLAPLNTVKIPRHLGIVDDQNAVYKLITCCDASETGLGAVSWLRTESKGKITTCLVGSTGHVAKFKPHKKKPELTIPRLELQAACDAVEFAHKIEKALNLPKLQKYFYSDSSAVLGQIHGMAGTRNIFTERRLEIIWDKSQREQWRHIKGTINRAADAISRTMTVEEFMEEKFLEEWIFGPSFMRQELFEPEFHAYTSTLDLNRPSMSTIYTQIARKVEHDEQKTDKEKFFENFQHKSTLGKNVRIMARVLQAVKKFKEKKHSKGQKTINYSTIIPIDSFELTEAKNALYRLEQHMKFPHVHKILEKNGNEIVTAENRQVKKNAQGVIRVSTRLQNIDEIETANPVLLPKLTAFDIECEIKEKKYSLTHQIIRSAHLITIHGSKEDCFHQIVREYYAPRLRSAIKTVMHKCLRCAKHKAQLSSQLMGNLPSERLMRGCKPFTVSHLDYLGPVLIKGTARRSARNDNDDKCEKKSYILVLVCGTTQALHLELVLDGTTAAFIEAMKRVYARRGNISILRSDNAGVFLQASKVITAKNSELVTGLAALREFAATRNTEWKFCTPRSPTTNGLAEKMVGLVKNRLKRLTMMAKLAPVALMTTLAEIEGAINSRPLIRTHDKKTIITPASFLVGESSLLPPCTLKCKTSNLTLMEQWKIQEEMKAMLWREFYPAYIQQLSARQKWKNIEKDIEVGELVLMSEPNLPSLQWPVGIVDSIVESKDGRVRIVRVQTASNKILERHVSKLCRLPVDLQLDSEKVDDGNIINISAPSTNAIDPNCTNDASTINSNDNQATSSVDNDISPVKDNKSPSKRKSDKKAKTDSAIKATPMAKDTVIVSDKVNDSTPIPRRSTRIKNKMTRNMMLFTAIFFGLAASILGQTTHVERGIHITPLKPAHIQKGVISVETNAEYNPEKAYISINKGINEFMRLCSKDQHTYINCEQHTAPTKLKAEKMLQHMNYVKDTYAKITSKVKREANPIKWFASLLHETIRIIFFGTKEEDEKKYNIQGKTAKMLFQREKLLEKAIREVERAQTRDSENFANLGYQIHAQLDHLLIVINEHIDEFMNIDDYKLDNDVLNQHLSTIHDDRLQSVFVNSAMRSTLKPEISYRLNMLTIKINYPIVERNRFGLMKFIPVPKNNLIQNFKASNYIVNLNKRQYIRMEDATCTDLPNNELLVRANIIRDITDESPCELRESIGMKGCEIKQLASTYIEQTGEINKYIYSAKSSILMCKDSSINLPRDGLLSIPVDCTARIDDITVTHLDMIKTVKETLHIESEDVTWANNDNNTSEPITELPMMPELEEEGEDNQFFFALIILGFINGIMALAFIYLCYFYRHDMRRQDGAYEMQDRATQTSSKSLTLSLGEPSPPTPKKKLTLSLGDEAFNTMNGSRSSEL
jgi:hypothetical protein